jgi:two-component system nitrate/nitrite response regulator NarL
MSDQVVTERSVSRRAHRDVRRLVPAARAERVRRRPPRPRVAVIERFALVAEAVGLTLKSSCEAIPIPLQTCTSTTQACDAVLRARADVAVLIVSPVGAVDLLTLVEQLSAHQISVLVTGEDLDPESAERYLCAGAAACWHTGGIADVVRAVEREAERRTRELPLPPIECHHVPAPRSPSELDGDRRARYDLGLLTAAEAKILGALMLGLGAEEIARGHVVSVATVRTQIRQVLGKLGAKSQVAAVALAWQIGWSPPPH